MSILDALILGLVQGLTEFLPVSSSGHLVLGQYLLNLHNTEMLAFDVYVHFGTLISVLIIFWTDVTQIILACWHALHTRTLRSAYESNEYVRLGAAILVGSVPAAIIGLRFHDEISAVFKDPKLVAVNLVVTGLILFLTKFPKPLEGKRLGLISGFVIGLAQSFAILPGISRSGSTISMGMYLRLPPLKAARFSFLLSVPVIAGAALLETGTVIRQGMQHGFAPFFVGLTAAAVSGYLAIKVLLRIVERGKLSWFAFYCLVLGIIGLIFI